MEKVPIQAVEMYRYIDFLSEEECNYCIDLILKNKQRSVTTRDEVSVVSDFRTSTTCTMPRDDPVIKDIKKRMCDALHLSSDLMEEIQGQHYEPGQYFKEHTDFFDPGTPSYEHHTKTNGNRTWTFMIYLNTTENGGSTEFSHINVGFTPKQGAAVIWNNQINGELNHNTAHQGMPVESGFKAIITQWFREK